MARLIDYILRSTEQYKYSSIETIIADEIANGMEDKIYRLTDYTNIAPPFPNFLLEWKLSENNVGGYLGLMFLDVASYPSPYIRPFDEPKGWRWKMAVSLIVKPFNIQTPKICLSHCVLFIDNDGQMLKTPLFVPSPLDGDIEQSSMGFAQCFPVAFITLAMLHCKNVTISSYAPPRKLSKRAEKEHGIPLHRFHTLNIRPMSSGRGELGSGSQSLKAAHIKRGHFKTFTDDAPLFGKWTGTYWWDSHVAGSKAKGTVDKHYRMLPE